MAVHSAESPAPLHACSPPGTTPTWTGRQVSADGGGSPCPPRLSTAWPPTRPLRLRSDGCSRSRGAPATIRSSSTSPTPPRRTGGQRRSIRGCGSWPAQHWPGPLTIVDAQAAWVSAGITGGQVTVALRVPDQGATRSVIQRLGELTGRAPGVVAPSANRLVPSAHGGRARPGESGAFLGAGDAVLDAGECPVGVESTIVAWDVGAGAPRVLRQGRSRCRRRAVGSRTVSRVLTSRTVPGGAAGAGALAAHYSPAGAGPAGRRGGCAAVPCPWGLWPRWSRRRQAGSGWRRRAMLRPTPGALRRAAVCRRRWASPSSSRCRGGRPTGARRPRPAATRRRPQPARPVRVPVPGRGRPRRSRSAR